jgi:hypothetical protein
VNRNIERGTFPVDMQVRLLNSDTDHLDAEVTAIREELKGQSRIMVGILISVATSAMLLAINVVIIRGGI